MAKNNPVAPYLIRSAVVKAPDQGYILAGDPANEEDESPHAVVFKWKAGVFSPGKLFYDAHTSCLISFPEDAIVRVSASGTYSVRSQAGRSQGNIFEDSVPKPKGMRTGDIRTVSEIAGKAYAVGNGGMVYRLDAMQKWTPIDAGLPRKFDIEAIDGLSASNLYVVGDRGGVWHFNGEKWTPEELPTNANLNAVKCAEENLIFVAGDEGVLVTGGKQKWKIIDTGDMSDDIWDLEWFKDRLYVSTFSNVYQLLKQSLKPVDFGDDLPKTCYQLSKAKGVLWSFGEKDIMSYDGNRWSRVV